MNEAVYERFRFIEEKVYWLQFIRCFRGPFILQMLHIPALLYPEHTGEGNRGSPRLVAETSGMFGGLACLVLICGVRLNRNCGAPFRPIAVSQCSLNMPRAEVFCQSKERREHAAYRNLCTYKEISLILCLSGSGGSIYTFKISRILLYGLSNYLVSQLWMH
jgi:hypothetical protein